MTKQAEMIIGIVFLLNINSGWGGDQVGTLTQVEGSVKIFHSPSKTLQKEQGAPHALFEGEYYLVQEAKPGNHVEKGNIVRVAPGAKARVVYENGDQLNIGSGTAYRVTWDKDSLESKTRIDLKYGKLRGIIEKGGPRSHLQIKTRTAVMGVRGTDFFIASGGPDENTEISIIRGSIEVTTQAQNTPVEVKSGFTAEAGFKPTIELRRTTQEEWKGIQTSSNLALPSTSSNPETGKKIEILEKKALATTLKDIQLSDKKLYASLTQQQGQTGGVDRVNQAAIQNMMEDAPKAPAKRKPYKSEIENTEEGVYEKYFKNLDQ